MQILTCEHCSKTFSPKRTNYNNPKRFCSIVCASDSKRTNNPKPCLHCGKETMNKLFCSRSCSASYNNTIAPKRQAHFKNVCETCGTPTNNNRWCCMSCRPKVSYKSYRARMNEANARYMSRRKYQTPADEDITALQEFYANCPEGYEVDHIIPISKGGLHTLSNLQYLTKTENRKKSNKIGAGGGIRTH